MNTPVIKIIGLRKSFTVGKSHIEALRGIDLEIRTGEFIVIYGPSGCGKSTLLSMLAGLDKPTEGQILVRDVDIYKLKERELAYYRRSKIGIVFQRFNLVSALSAKDNIGLPLTLSGTNRQETSDRAKELLKTVGLTDRAEHRPSEISGGEQQRVAIARALSSNPWILLVDEPTGNLDLEAGNEIMEMLKRVNKWGRTIILVTHNPEYVRFGDRVVYMQDGKIVDEKRNHALVGSESNKKLDYYIASKRSGRLRFPDAMKLSYAHFVSKKVRTFLTTLGVALGVSSIITLVSLGVGLQQVTAKQIASLNALVTISVSTQKNSINDLTEKTATSIGAINHVALVSPSITVPAKATFDQSTTQIVVQGLNRESLDFEDIKMIAGEPYADDNSVIVSRAVVKNLDIQDENDLVGKKINLTLVRTADQSELDTYGIPALKSVNYSPTVVGITGDMLTATIYAPLAKIKSLGAVSKYSALKVKTDDRKNVDVVRQAIETQGFATSSVVDLIKQVDKVFLVAQIILGIIGAVALIVALIGIANIMTISLLERTHEVGIIKAVGATNKDIRRIFLYEVFFFGLFGGTVGIGSAWLFGQGINALIKYLATQGNLPNSVQVFATPLNFIIEMLALTILVSIAAGWYPARRAARLSPMEALRHE